MIVDYTTKKHPNFSHADMRRYLNETCKDLARWKNGRYEQRKRQYGDYLYAQDRPMFLCVYDEHVRKLIAAGELKTEGSK